MKHVILIISLIFSASSLFAQLVQPLEHETTDIAGEPIIEEGSVDVPADYELKTHFDIQNVSGETIELRVRRFPVDMVEGSTNKFCWAGLCYGLEDDFSLNTIEMAPGQIFNSANPAEQFVGYYYHNGTSGCSTMDYRFINVDNLEMTTDIRVIYAVDCAVGIEEQTNVSAKLSEAAPNPASTTTSLSYDFGYRPSNGFLRIYNMMGKLVKEISVEQRMGALFVGVEDLTDGIYLYTLNDGNAVKATKKLVVAK